MSKDEATHGEVERNLGPLLFYIGKKAGLFVSYKLVSQSCGGGIGEEKSKKADQSKIGRHSA